MPRRNHLPRGVTIDSLAAVKDTGQGHTYIRATVHNDSAQDAESPVLALFPVAGRPGQCSSAPHRPQTLQPAPYKQSWNVTAATPPPFSRFSAYEIKAE